MLTFMWNFTLTDNLHTFGMLYNFPVSQHFESFLTVLSYAVQTVYSIDYIEMLWGSRGIFIYYFMPHPKGKLQKAFQLDVGMFVGTQVSGKQFIAALL